MKSKLSEDKNLINEQEDYLPFSKYPAIIREIALMVEPGTKIVRVMNLINAAGGPLISDVDLLDMSRDEESPNDKKSLVFRIIYQVKNRALTDKEVDILQNKITKALEEEGGWEVRK